MKSSLSPCSSLKVNRGFGGTCHLYFQNSKVDHARNQHEICSKFQHCEWSRHVPVKRQFNSNGLYGVIAQIATAVRTSNPGRVWFTIQDVKRYANIYLEVKVDTTSMFYFVQKQVSQLRTPSILRVINFRYMFNCTTLAVGLCWWCEHTEW
jgi:hypothetical protein